MSPHDFVFWNGAVLDTEGHGIDGVMSVGAAGPSLARAFYSNTGPHIEISAPGGSDHEGGSGGMVWQSTICGDDFDSRSIVVPRFDRSCETPEEGTSMAAPHVRDRGAHHGPGRDQSCGSRSADQGHRFSTAFEVQYTYVPHALNGGAAAAFNERNLGGLQARLKVSVEH